MPAARTALSAQSAIEVPVITLQILKEKTPEEKSRLCRMEGRRLALGRDFDCREDGSRHKIGRLRDEGK